MLKQSILLLTGSQDSADLRLKQSLLITHGTVYGYTVPEALAKEYVGISSSFTNGWVLPWRQDLYPALPATPAIFGPLTHNEPIDFIHWYAGPGSVGEDGLEWWRQCLTLLRHI